jgi:hypothetical protein
VETKTTAPAGSTAAATALATTPAAPPAIVIEMKKMGRKKLRALRKGRGVAMIEMNEAIDELRRNGTIAADAQLVIAIVKKKRKKRAAGLFSP